MDNILGKYSVYDFFNLICTGAVFLIGLQFLGIDMYTALLTLFSVDILQEINMINLFIIVFLLIGVCYIIGSVIQEFSGFLEKKVFRIYDKAIERLMYDKKVITNDIKRQVYIAEAKNC